MTLARIFDSRPVEVVRYIVGDIPEIATPLFTAASPCCRDRDLFAPVGVSPSAFNGPLATRRICSVVALPPIATVSGIDL